MPPLTDTAIRNLKPTETACKLFGVGGLYLLVNPTGRMKYRVDGREKLIRFGQYPDVATESCARTTGLSAAIDRRSRRPEREEES